MDMGLKIQLPTNWYQCQSQQGPTSFHRHDSTSAFQVSSAEYKGEQALSKRGTDELKQMAIGFGRKTGFGENVVESAGGPCAFGNFGTAVFRSVSHPRTQVWIITDGRDHILATHICSDEPDPVEVQETQEMARSLSLGPDDPK
jgi:hypothetical protein